MKKKIKKVTPIKSETLCEKCEYSYGNFCKFRKCENCELHKGLKNGLLRCSCNLIDYGEKCEDFKRKIPSLQMGNFKCTPHKNGLNMMYSPKVNKNEV